MKVTFPYWGNYTIAFEALAEKLGLKLLLRKKQIQKQFRPVQRLLRKCIVSP